MLLLIALVLDFESHRGEILNLSAKKKKLRLTWLGRKSTRVDEGRKGESLLAIKMQGTNRSSGEGGEGPAMRHVTPDGSELRL